VHIWKVAKTWQFHNFYFACAKIYFEQDGDVMSRVELPNTPVSPPQLLDITDDGVVDVIVETSVAYPCFTIWKFIYLLINYFKINQFSLLICRRPLTNNNFNGHPLYLGFAFLFIYFGIGQVLRIHTSVERGFDHFTICWRFACLGFRIRVFGHVFSTGKQTHGRIIRLAVCHCVRLLSRDLTVHFLYISRSDFFIARSIARAESCSVTILCSELSPFSSSFWLFEIINM
jgi:hypothetical protein